MNRGTQKSDALRSADDAVPTSRAGARTQLPAPGYDAEPNVTSGPDVIERVDSRRPIRLMHLITTLALSGLEYGVIKLVNRLPEDRFESTICCLSGTQPDAREAVQPHVRVVELNKRKGVDLAVVPKLLKSMRRFDTQILHSHNWGTYPYAVAAQLLGHGVRLVHGEHGRETPDWTLTRLQRLTPPRGG